MSIDAEIPVLPLEPGYTLTLPSRFDVHAAQSFLEEVDLLAAQPGQSLLLDASQVRFIDRFGLRALCTAREAKVRRGIGFYVGAPSCIMRVTLRLQGQEALLPATNSSDEMAA